MLNEIQTAKRSRNSIPKGRPNCCEGSSSSHSGPNSRNKKNLP